MSGILGACEEIGGLNIVYEGANSTVPVDLVISYTKPIAVLEVPKPPYPSHFIPANSHRMSNDERHYNAFKEIST